MPRLSACGKHLGRYCCTVDRIDVHMSGEGNDFINVNISHWSKP